MLTNSQIQWFQDRGWKYILSDGVLIYEGSGMVLDVVTGEFYVDKDHWAYDVYLDGYFTGQRDERLAVMLDDGRGV